MWILYIIHIAFASMHLAPGPKFLVMTIDNTVIIVSQVSRTRLSTLARITGTRQAGLGTFIQIIVKLMPPEDFTQFLPICSSPVKAL